jgi:hypothetical protein
MVFRRTRLRTCRRPLLPLLCAFAVGPGCAALDREDASTRVAGAIYIATGRAVWVRPDDLLRAVCVDRQPVVCEAAVGRLDARRCSCPLPSQ